MVTASPQFHAPLYISKGEIWIDDNTTLTPANFNIQVYNNIFIDNSGNGEEDYTVQIREAALTGTNLINHNIYKKTTGAASFDDGVSWPALTFLQWKSQLGFDAQSIEGNPGLNAQFHLNSGSPAIDAGQACPAVRDYDAQLRSGIPDIGADEFGNGIALQVPPPSNVYGTGVNAILIATHEPLPVIEALVSPNPASDYLMVKTAPQNGTPTLTLRSLDGKQMETSSGNKISTENLPNGLYLLVVSANGGQVSVPVFIQH